MGRDDGGCSLCRLINIGLTLTFLGVGGYLIWYFLGEPDIDDVKGAIKNAGDFSDVLRNISGFDFGDFYDNDPFLSNNSTNSWPTDGQSGLPLEIVNALDDTWQTEFSTAVSDWDSGSPDALTLTTTKADVDYTCKEHIDGLLKVCSGNFGDTGWLGINELLTSTRDGSIVSSVAKMNEYYLRNADIEERQYTMCHEIGHGFGLPHTDENFNNAPLGNCMDYTNQPEANMHPDETNYRRLSSIYGTVNRRHRRRLGGSGDVTRNPSLQRVLTEDLQAQYEDAIAEIQQLSVRRALKEGSANSRWELLEDEIGGAIYSSTLGDEYEIEVHLLHPFPRK